MATVTNIKDRQVFKKRHGPGQVKGTLALDPNGVGGVQMRLTRSVRTRVKVKVKTRKKAKRGRRAKVKYRYKTVTRCTQWNDSTALLQSMRRCGTKYGTWFPADVGDPVSTFSYSFAMTLPRGQLRPGGQGLRREQVHRRAGRGPQRHPLHRQVATVKRSPAPLA